MINPQNTKGNWQVGEEVVRYNGRGVSRVVTIERVTPSGQAIAGGERFTPRGDRVGDTSAYYRVSIARADPETIIATRAKAAVADALSAVETAWTYIARDKKACKLSAETLLRAAALLRGEEDGR